jgi:hypothetical protein
VAAAQGTFYSGPAKILLDFLAEAKRGVARDAGKAPGGNEDE